jgi:hypothetical protein
MNGTRVSNKPIEETSCVVMDAFVSKAKAKMEREGLTWGDIIGEGKPDE